MGRGKTDDIFYGDVFYETEAEDLPLSSFDHSLDQLAPRLKQESIVLFSSVLRREDNRTHFVKVHIALERGPDGEPWYRAFVEKSKIDGLVYKGPQLSKAVDSASRYLKDSLADGYGYCAALGRVATSAEDIPLPTEGEIEKEIIAIAAGRHSII